LSITVKSIVAAAITHPVIGRTIGAVYGQRIPNRGIVVDTSSPLITPRMKGYLFWGLYESAELRFLHKYLRTDLDVIELGASIGVVSCQIRKRIAPERKLVAVEADWRLIEVLRRNLELNELARNVQILNAAVCADGGAGMAYFSVGQNNISGKLSANRNGNTSEVPALTLDGIAERSDIREYALVSDIEGAETSFIFGADAALAGCRQIIIELHDCEFAGEYVTVHQLREAIVRKHGFALRDSYGPVCVFER